MLLFLVACNLGPPGGTAVGNPTGLVVDTAPGTSTNFTSASAKAESVEQTTCDGTVQSIPVDDTIDLLGGSYIELGTGIFCSLTLNFSEPLAMTGTGSGHILNLTLDIEKVSVSADAILAGEYILELGSPGWVDLLDKDLESGDVEMKSGDPRAKAIEQALTKGTTLYQDGNEDGKIDGDERDHHSGESEEDESLRRSSHPDAPVTAEDLDPMQEAASP